MIINIYSMRDLKGSFIAPHVDMNDQMAIRNFSFAVNNNHDIMGFAPQDFQLYRVGQFDSITGEIHPVIPVELVTDGAQVFGVKYEK